MSNTALAPRSVATTLTANGAVAAGTHRPADATSGAITVTLPAASSANAGASLSVEKLDSSVNVVTISGSIRGATTTISLALQFETVEFVADAAGSWHPVAGHKTLGSLDGRYVAAASAAPLAQAGQTPSQAPVAPGTSAVGALAFTARADHVHPSAGVYGFYGDGSDGTLVLDGTSTVAGFTRSGTTYSATGVIFANNLTINAGVTLQPQQFSIYVLGTLTNNGHISGDGLNASGATQGGVIQAAGGWYLNLGGLGASGGTGAGATGQLTRTPTNANPPSQAQYGGGGGAGGAGASGAAGAATTQPGAAIFGAYPFARMIKAAQLAFLGVVPLMHSASGMDVLWGGNGGSAGGGDGTNSGGGGGGGGTPVLLNARVIVNNGTITSNGGNGGTPPTGNCGGGGGGGAGPILVNTTSLSGSGTITANGGAAGAAVGTGSAGSAGAAAYVQTTVWA